MPNKVTSNDKMGEQPYDLDQLNQNILAEVSRTLELNVVGAVYDFEVPVRYRQHFTADQFGFGAILHSSEYNLTVTYEGYMLFFEKLEQLPLQLSRKTKPRKAQRKLGALRR